MSGVIPASSAGGEQPKFTAFCGDCSAHVIVKFSPKGNDAVARRWRDILITEYHATEAIHAQDFPAAETQLIEEYRKHKHPPPKNPPLLNNHPPLLNNHPPRFSP